MKVLVRGNQVLIQTNLSAEDYDKYNKHGVFAVVDDNGDTTYKVTRGYNGMIRNFGITCDTTFQGKLAMGGQFDGEADEAAEFVESIKPELLALKENEAKIQTQITALVERLGSINEDITIEE